MIEFERVLRTGLSSLWDRAAARLAGSRFNPSRRTQFLLGSVFWFIGGCFAGAQGKVLGTLCFWGLAGLGVYGAWTMDER